MQNKKPRTWKIPDQTSGEIFGEVQEWIANALVNLLEKNINNFLEEALVLFKEKYNLLSILGWTSSEFFKTILVGNPKEN